MIRQGACLCQCIQQLSALQASIPIENAAQACAGPLPASWSALRNLIVLDMHSNNLTGVLYKHVGHFSLLTCLTALSSACKHPGLMLPDGVQGSCHPRGLR